MTPPFAKFVKNSWAGRLITFDPGETTGWSVWDNSQLTSCGQLDTHTVKGSIHMLQNWIAMADIGAKNFLGVYCVIEEYRVYAQKAQEHAQNTMHTSRLIGCLETLLVLRGIRYEMRGAGLAKTFCDDQKLTDWGFWVRGERHARDAIRHGAYFLCCGKPPPAG